MSATMLEPIRPATPRRFSFLRSVRAVAWSFFGVRKKSEYQEDLRRINPLHVIVIGMAGALLLVLVLAGVVNWVVAN